MAAIRGGKSYILVNGKLSERERAKVILHELCHLLCHFDNYLRPAFLDCPTFLDHEFFIAGWEKEADYFAYLLMKEWIEEEEWE